MTHSTIRELSAAFSGAGLDAYFVLNSTNIRYLTGHPSRDSWLLVTRDRAFYVTDFRYTGEVTRALKGRDIEICEHQGTPFAFALELAAKHKALAVGFDTRHLSLAEYGALKKSCPPGLRLRPVNGLVEKLRLLKQPAELRMIRKALVYHHQALTYLRKVIRPGVTEQDVLFKLRSHVHGQGLDFSFDPIIASGPHSSYPHASVTRRKIGTNDAVLVDFGIDYKGYKSDLTRMFYLGRIPKLLEDIRGYVAQAQARAIAVIKPGVAVSVVDQAARQFLKEQKLDQYFGHSLGHGVGLEIHEAPRLSVKSQEILEPGMVVTVEPGVYLTGRFGVRLEEMVIITPTGCEVISDHRN